MQQLAIDGRSNMMAAVEKVNFEARIRLYQVGGEREENKEKKKSIGEQWQVKKVKKVHV